MEIEIRTSEHYDAIKWEGTYLNGVLHGYYRSWYKNGNIWYDATYKHGVTIGMYKSWKSNGTRLNIATINSSKEIRMYIHHGPKIKFRYGD
jgi:antitoxin component YwqK of YwqJK toxin-antitoxin module